MLRSKVPCPFPYTSPCRVLAAVLKPFLPSRQSVCVSLEAWSASSLPQEASIGRTWVPSKAMPGPGEPRVSLGQDRHPGTCSWGQSQTGTRHPGTLTESCLGPGSGAGAGREVWLTLGRCFLGSQGSRPQSRVRCGLGSCSIHPTGPRHHGRGSRQQGCLGGGQTQGGYAG